MFCPARRDALECSGAQSRRTLRYSKRLGRSKDVVLLSIAFHCAPKGRNYMQIARKNLSLLFNGLDVNPQKGGWTDSGCEGGASDDRMEGVLRWQGRKD